MAARLELGKKVRCGGEVVGELTDVVVDPEAKRLTHLVVKPRHARAEAHLVAIDLADVGEDGSIELSLGAEDFRSLPNIESVTYARIGSSLVNDPNWDVGVSDVLAVPYDEVTSMGGYIGPIGQEVAMVYDVVPKGEVELRRSSSVVTSDGHDAGVVDGFVVGDDERITHFVLERGHLWRKRKVLVPLEAVAGVESDTVTLALSADQVDDHPADGS